MIDESVALGPPTGRITATVWPGPRFVEAMHGSGRWQPSPFREYVITVHERSNLACSHGYVETTQDQTWRSRPLTKSPVTWRATADRISEHCQKHGLHAVRIVLHGGEPMLAGVDRLIHIVEAVRSALPDDVTAQVVVQS